MWAMFIMAALFSVGMAYISPGKEHFLTDALLREVVDRMGRDLADAADTYLDSSEKGYMSSRAMKMLENEEPNYSLDLEGLAPPSLRDREFLQHSSLWGSQFVRDPEQMKTDAGNIGQQQMKSDPTLPAYCNPPNPCPVGYSAEDGCLEEFENTASFSRKFQEEQQCMCDTEHMFDCPVRDYDPEMEVESIINEIAGKNQHKNLVAKKFHVKKATNPYLQGEKLPIAAKKGIKLEDD